MVVSGLNVSSGFGRAVVTTVVGVVVIGCSVGTLLPAIVMSAHARNSSCGPQPIAPVPLGQFPQLFPTKQKQKQ